MLHDDEIDVETTHNWIRMIPSILIRILILGMIFWASGVVLGLATAWCEIGLNGYMSKSFYANLIETCETNTMWNALAVLSIGIIGSLIMVCKINFEKYSGKKDMVLGNRSFWSYCLVITYGFIALTVQLVILNDRYAVSNRTVVFLIAASLLLLFLRKWMNVRVRPWADAGILILLLGIGAIIFVLDNSTILSLYIRYRHPFALIGVVACWILLFSSLLVFRFDEGLASRSMKKMAFRNILIAALAFLSVIPLTLLLLSRAGNIHTLTASNPKNIVLIGIDTLCWDHTYIENSNPYYRKTTPNLNKLARESMIFENAISQAPWTMPAFASILTGKYPRNHGATSLKGRLSKRETTLAEILRESGYWTGAVVSHMYVDELRGFSQGFDSFDESSKKAGTLGITSQKLTSTIIDLLLSRPSEKPFFIFAHYFDPHYEFRNHKEFGFADNYSGWLTPPLLNITNLRSMRHELQQRDLDHIESLYDEEISFCDQEVGRLFDFLNRMELMDDTIIIVVSDHGEEFMERGWLGHTITLFDELIHVPMIISLPDNDMPARRVSDVVETRAIFPSILDYLGIIPDSDRTNTSLIRNSPDKTDDSLHFAFSEVWLPRAPAASGKRVLLSSVRTNDHKLIMDHQKKRTHFFNLKEDPLEQKNLTTLDEYEETYRKLHQLLQSTMKRMPGGNIRFPHIKSDPDLTRKLESLGYL